MQECKPDPLLFMLLSRLYGETMRNGWLGLGLLAIGVAALACGGGAAGGGDLILPGEGVAGLLLGDDATRVVALLGEPEDTATHGVAGAVVSISKYYIYRSRGIDVLLLDGEVKTIFLYNDEAEDHARHPGRTPHGLTLASTRPEVLEALGPPDRFGPGDVRDRLYEYNRDGIEFIFRPDDTIHNLVIKAPVSQ